MSGMEMLAGAGIGVNLLGTLTSAGAQKQQGDVAAGASRINGQINAQLDNYRASLSDYNAQVDQQEAARAVDEAKATADIIERSSSRALGRATAAYGAAGVNMSGSALAVMHDLATEGALQKQLAIYGGDVKATDLRNRATLDTAQANIYRATAMRDIWAGNYAADAAERGAATGSAATLLTGLARAGMSGYDLYSTGGGISSAQRTLGQSAASTSGQAGMFGMNYASGT